MLLKMIKQNLFIGFLIKSYRVIYLKFPTRKVINHYRFSHIRNDHFLHNFLIMVNKFIYSYPYQQLHYHKFNLNSINVLLINFQKYLQLHHLFLYLVFPNTKIIPQVINLIPMLSLNNHCMSNLKVKFDCFPYILLLNYFLFFIKKNIIFITKLQLVYVNLLYHKISFLQKMTQYMFMPLYKI